MTMNKEHLLTIAIPTYNRPEQLRSTLEIVLPQIEKENRVRLLILDNHSAISAIQVLTDMGVSESEQVRVIRHPYNLGGLANSMRCFELCETEWLWVLADDDKVSVDAVETIMADFPGPHVWAFYNFPSRGISKPIPYGRLEGKTIKGLFDASGHCACPFAFLSANVYRMSVIRKCISKGYSCMSSHIPHVAMALAAIEDGGGWLLSEKTICDHQAPSNEQMWMYYPVFLGWLMVCIAFEQTKSVGEFRRTMQVDYGRCPEILLLDYIAWYQLKTAFSPRGGHGFRIMKVFYSPPYWLEPVSWTKWQAVAIAAYFPTLYVRALQLYCRILGKKLPPMGLRERNN